MAVDWEKQVENDIWYQLITEELVMNLAVSSLSSKSIMIQHKPAVEIAVLMLKLQQVPKWISDVFDDSCISGAVVLTDIVFCGLLLPFQTGDDFKLTLLIGCMHSLNAVFLLVDSALNSLQFTWHGLTYFILWSATYIVFQWVMRACCFTRWPYPFLELATPWAPMWYFGIALFHLPCYGLYLLLVKAKVSMSPCAFTR